MATQRDYYEILSVTRTATHEEIKRSYRKLAMKYHPDRNPGDAESEQKFKEAAEAYEVLCDQQKRAMYDQYGHAGLRGTTSHVDAEDLFSSLFGDMLDGFFGGGGRRRGGGRRGAQGASLETVIEMTLEEVASGVQKEVEFTRLDTCDHCSGTGGKPGAEPVTCVTCGGIGQVEQVGLGGMFRMRSTCPACKGAGKTYREKCPECSGHGKRPRKRVLNVEIPPGIHDGQAVRVAGEGEPGSAGGPAGDLHVVIRVRKHTMFERQDDHLVVKAPISFTQATLGAKLKVPTLEGAEEITIHPGTQHGEIQRIPGKGLPNLRTGQRGDVVVFLLIEIPDPKKLTDHQRKLLREFAETENHDLLPESKSFWNKITEMFGAHS